MARRRRTQHNWSTAIATLGGLGGVRWAPGTWGSAVGILFGIWLTDLTAERASLLLLGGLVLLSVLITERAERVLQWRDAPQIILDEAVAMTGIMVVMPWLQFSWGWVAAAFALFRLFDIVKPPPLRELGRLYGGWGIVGDDFGAAVYTVLVLEIARQTGWFPV